MSHDAPELAVHKEWLGQIQQVGLVVSPHVLAKHNVGIDRQRSLEEDHMRDRHMIVSWLMAHTTAIEARRRDGKTYFVMTDVAAFRDGVARLLAEVQRIKAEGDYAAARQLFDTYGVHFDPALRDEVVARVDALNLPSYTGFVMPRLEAVYGGDGTITDVEISYPLDLTTQMLEYAALARGDKGPRV